MQGSLLKLLLPFAGTVLGVVFPCSCWGFQGVSPDRVDVSDGFEASALSDLWIRDRFAPGAVTMQSEIVRSGRGAVKITVRRRDKFEPGIGGSRDTERDELLESPRLFSREDVTYEHTVSMYFPPDFPMVPTRLVLAQWKQYCEKAEACGDNSPVVAVRYVAGELRITRQTAKKAVTLYRSAIDLRGK